MHGVVEILPLAEGVDVDAGDAGSGRTALHKAAYWGHAHSIKLMVEALHADPNRWVQGTGVLGVS
jgi:ankyrin repeat protein